MLDLLLLPFPLLQDKIEELFRKCYQKNAPPTLISFLNMMVCHSIESPATATALFEFSHSKKEIKLVKITTADVPSGILPGGISATLYDIKVDGCGPDDEIYNEYPDIREKIPRGCTLLKVTGEEDWQDVVIYANRKFTGGIGDEDEVQPGSNELWKEYFIKDYCEAKQVVGMTKVNGEAAHFSARFIEGKFYLITGSKNVHLIMEKKEDLDLYTGERYGVAKVVAQCVYEKLESMEKEHRILLLSLLHHTKSTVVCEILQPNYQHIINLSNLPQPQLWFLSLTPSPGENGNNSLLAVPPHHSLDLMSALGLICPEYTLIPAQEVSEYKDKIRYDLNKEGEVLYFLDAAENTIGLVKVKTMWYIMLRAVREKSVYCFMSRKKHQDWTLEHNIESVSKRLGNIQGWLKFSDNFLNEWKALAKSFLEWLNVELADKEASVSIRPKFPVIWAKFLAETNQTDNIPIIF